MMQRKHMLVSAPLGRIDFRRAELTPDGLWFQSATLSWLPILLPNIYAACGNSDLSFSSFRDLPMFKDPRMLPLPDGAGYSVRLIAPLGGGHGELWGGLLYHSAQADPVPCMEKFSPNNNSVRRVVENFFTPERIDSYRKPDKPREELWTRFDLAIEDLLPGAYPLPNWQKAVAGLPHEEAAAKMDALRAPTSAGEYFRLRAAERAKQEAAEKQAAAAEAADAEDFAVKAVALDQLTRTAEPPKDEPKVMSREDLQEARKRREKQAKATQGKVFAPIRETPPRRRPGPTAWWRSCHEWPNPKMEGLRLPGRHCRSGQRYPFGFRFGWL